MVFGGWCWISSQSHPRTTQGFLSRSTQACSVIPQCTRIKSKLSRLPAFSSHCVTVFCLILQGPEALFYVKIIFVFSTILRKLQALFCLSELFLCFLLQVSSLLSFHFIFSISMSSSICVNVFSTKKPDVTFLDFHDLSDLS